MRAIGWCRRRIWQAGEAILAAVEEFHARNRSVKVCRVRKLATGCSAGVDAAVFEAVMQGLTAARARDRAPGDAWLQDGAAGGEATVAAVEPRPPTGGRTHAAGVGGHWAATQAPAVVETATTYLLRQKVLVKLDTLLVHREALEGLKRDMAALKVSGGGGVVRLDVATFKEQYGVTRKFAIPLLEYLDRERVTRRMGDARVLL